MPPRPDNRSNETIPQSRTLASVVASDLHAFKDNMTLEDFRKWFQQQLNRPPEPHDLYFAGKELFQLGAYTRAKICLELYVKLPRPLPPGHHLLGYVYYMLKRPKDAIPHFRQCVQDGFDSDWQLLVELQVEMEELAEDDDAVIFTEPVAVRMPVSHMDVERNAAAAAAAASHTKDSTKDLEKEALPTPDARKEGPAPPGPQIGAVIGGTAAPGPTHSKQAPRKGLTLSKPSQGHQKQDSGGPSSLAPMAVGFKRG
eukprot:Rmarinus@m.30211